MLYVTQLNGNVVHSPVVYWSVCGWVRGGVPGWGPGVGSGGGSVGGSGGGSICGPQGLLRPPSLVYSSAVSCIVRELCCVVKGLHVDLSGRGMVTHASPSRWLTCTIQ